MLPSNPVLLVPARSVIVAASDNTITTNFLARTSGLDATHTNAYKALINGLVTDGICADTTWGPFDCLYITATQDSTTAKLNLVSSSFGLVTHGGVSFTADLGFLGDGANGSYIDTQYTPSSNGVQWTLNSAHASGWNLVNNSDAPLISDNNNDLDLYPNYSEDGLLHLRGPNDGTFGSGLTNADTRGHFLGNRDSSTTKQIYKNAASVGSLGTVNSTSTSANNVRLLGTGSFNSIYRIAQASLGGSLSSGNVTLFYNRLRTYMTTVGVP